MSIQTALIRLLYRALSLGTAAASDFKHIKRRTAARVIQNDLVDSMQTLSRNHPHLLSKDRRKTAKVLKSLRVTPSSIKSKHAQFAVSFIQRTLKHKFCRIMVRAGGVSVSKLSQHKPLTHIEPELLKISGICITTSKSSGTHERRPIPVRESFVALRHRRPRRPEDPICCSLEGKRINSPWSKFKPVPSWHCDYQPLPTTALPDETTDARNRCLQSVISRFRRIIAPEFVLQNRFGHRTPSLHP